MSLNEFDDFSFLFSRVYLFITQPSSYLNEFGLHFACKIKADDETTQSMVTLVCSSESLSAQQTSFLSVFKDKC